MVFFPSFFLFFYVSFRFVSFQYFFFFVFEMCLFFSHPILFVYFILCFVHRTTLHSERKTLASSLFTPLRHFNYVLFLFSICWTKRRFNEILHSLNSFQLPCSKCAQGHTHISFAFQMKERTEWNKNNNNDDATYKSQLHLNIRRAAHKMRGKTSTNLKQFNWNEMQQIELESISVFCEPWIFDHTFDHISFYLEFENDWIDKIDSSEWQVQQIHHLLRITNSVRCFC